jgi:enamine deaminase RidA (YjgF/YER057c/UK114 family)
MSTRSLVSSGSPNEPVIGFSRAVRVGSMIFVSGTGPMGADGTLVGPNDVYAQTKQCLETIKTAIEQAGGAITDTVRTVVMLTSMDQWKEAARAHGEMFGDIRPACTFVQVSGFVSPDWLVEIQADAVIGQ